LTQFVSPDDEHDVIETCRELKIKINTYKRIVRHVGHLPRIRCYMLHVLPEASVSLSFVEKHKACIPQISPRPSSLSFAVYFTLYRNGINQPHVVSDVNFN
jgi:hypothetical protein